MKELISIILIAISLSMDSFSISLILSNLNISKKKMLLFILLVGIMHFFMPLIGIIIGNNIIRILNIRPNILLGLILLFISIDMIINIITEENKEYEMYLLNIIILALSVSIDSFTVGCGLSAITNKFILSSLLFSISALLITYIGFIIGKYSNKILGKYSIYLSIILLIIFGLINIL